MSKRKKISFWVLGGVGTLLVLLLITALLLPRLIALEPLKEEVLANISQRIGGNIKSQSMDFSLFLRPHVVLQKTSLFIPGRASGTVDSLSIYPKILPLLLGKVSPARIKLEDSHIEVMLPTRVARDKERKQPFSRIAIQEKLAAALVLVGSKLPGLTVLVTNGRLDLANENKSIFRFQDIQARIDLSPKKLKVDASCKSNLGETVSFKARLDAQDFKGSGFFRLGHFQPQPLIEYFFPTFPYKLAESVLDLNISFRAAGPRDLQAEIQASIPSMTLYRGNESLVTRAGSLITAIDAKGSKMAVSLSQLDFIYPKLSLTGEFLWDQASPQVSLELEGRDVDVHSTREAALALAGDNPSIKDIFEVVKGGKLPNITFNAHGKSVADLGKTENFLIRGNMREGRIFVSGPDLDLADVKGEAVISNGILEGKNAEARLENSRGRQATLKLGLEGEDRPFHLDIMVDADLVQLPPVLKRVAENESFIEELNLISDVKGRATGKLILGENTREIATHVEVSDFNLHATYKRVPYPLEITGGHFVYDNTGIQVENLKGQLVESSFSEISGRFDWEKKPYFEVETGKSEIYIGEIYPWLASIDRISGLIKNVEGVKGTLAVSALSLQGPLLVPENWQLNITGEMKHLSLRMGTFEAPIEVTGGHFDAFEDATEQKLTFKDARVKALDGSLQVSGVLNDYLKGVNKADLNFHGNMKADSSRWLAKLIRLPSELSPRSPLSISQAHLVWEKESKTSVTANLAVQSGPELSLDIVQEPRELMIKNLLIQDSQSRASLGLNLKEKEFSVRFAGNLTGATMSKLLQENQYLQGRLEGNFQADILLKQPARSTVTGKLSGHGLVFPHAPSASLKIENISLDGRKDTIKVESAACTWGDSRAFLAGNVDFKDAGFLIDLDLAADHIDGDKVSGILKRDGKEREAQQEEKFWDIPVQGVLRLKSEHLKYQNLAWSPLHADISFDNKRIYAAITAAELCSISMPGVISVTPKDLSIAFKPVAESQELASTVACLWNKKEIVSGKFNLKGEALAQGNNGELTRSLRGNVRFVAEDGRIYRVSRFGAMVKTFALLETTDIFRGELPDLEKEGFAYDAMTVKGNLGNGKLILTEAAIDAPSMQIVFLGDIDLADRKLDLEVLVAPLQTIDSVVEKIPVVTHILGGRVVSIPIKVKGDMENPKVTPLAPTAVGKQLLRLVERVLTLPVKVIQPLLPEKEGKEQDRQKPGSDNIESRP